MSGLLCCLVGHRVPSPPRRTLDSRVQFMGADGLGGYHYQVVQACARCRQRFVVGRFTAYVEHGRPEVY